MAVYPTVGFLRQTSNDRFLKCRSAALAKVDRRLWAELSFAHPIQTYLRYLVPSAI